VDNIKMDLGVIGWGVVDWNGLVQDKEKWGALLNVDSIFTCYIPFQLIKMEQINDKYFHRNTTKLYNQYTKGNILFNDFLGMQDIVIYL
jgi:hypothetical protein